MDGGVKKEESARKSQSEEVNGRCVYVSTKNKNIEEIAAKKI